MGEMAEYAIQEGMDALDYIVEDRNLTDQYGNPINQEPAPRFRPRKTCRSCGAASLVWGHSTSTMRWLLYNTDGTLHECPVNPLPKEGNE